VERLNFGDFELTILSDGNYWLDGGAMFGVVPKPLWERKFPPDNLNRLRVGLNSLLIRSDEHTILVETGIGNKLPEKTKKIFGNEQLLLASFEQAGVSPDDVDIVINSHLHFDHCGWNTMLKAGKVIPTFPRAKYYFQRGEWEHGQRQYERDRVSYISDNYNPLIENGQAELLSGDREIVPGISVRVMPGHTDNMQAVMVESQGKTACYISDLIPTTRHIEVTWVMAYDLAPLQTIENRKKFYAQAVPGNWVVVFTHDPDMPWAYVEERGDGKYAARAIGGEKVLQETASAATHAVTHVAD
jgi:glyoxylase-like metal-dependent hydrolase (beta-lactamase superfamily II)